MSDNSCTTKAKAEVRRMQADKIFVFIITTTAIIFIKRGKQVKQGKRDALCK